MLASLLKGLLIGFSIAAPVGPIGLLCIRRSLNEGRTAGFVSGLGAATADACYGFVAAFGLTAIGHLLLAERIWLQAIGGLFLVYLGIATARSKPSAAAATPRAHRSAYVSTFVLTLTNPMTILSFVGIFAGLGVGTAAGAGSPLWLVVGVFTGSAAWWFLLSTSVNWLGRRVQPDRLRTLNLLGGAVILGFGLWQLTLTVRSLR